MVGVAQSVELRIVIPAVEGSIPFAHPIFKQGFTKLIVYFVKKWFKIQKVDKAKVAELVDALDLGSSVLRRESSSLSFRTMSNFIVELKFNASLLS